MHGQSVLISSACFNCSVKCCDLFNKLCVSLVVVCMHSWQRDVPVCSETGSRLSWSQGHSRSGQVFTGGDERPKTRRPKVCLGDKTSDVSWWWWWWRWCCRWICIASETTLWTCGHWVCKLLNDFSLCVNTGDSGFMWYIQVCCFCVFVKISVEWRLVHVLFLMLFCRILIPCTYNFLFRSVLWQFSLVGWLEEHPACKSLLQTSQTVLFWVGPGAAWSIGGKEG